jgi:hypothetical protein
MNSHSVRVLDFPDSVLPRPSLLKQAHTNAIIYLLAENICNAERGGSGPEPVPDRTRGLTHRERRGSFYRAALTLTCYTDLSPGGAINNQT